MAKWAIDDSVLAELCDFVTSDNYWQIASLVTRKSFFMVSHALFFISYIWMIYLTN